MGETIPLADIPVKRLLVLRPRPMTRHPSTDNRHGPDSRRVVHIGDAMVGLPRLGDFGSSGDGDEALGFGEGTQRRRRRC